MRPTPELTKLLPPARGRDDTLTYSQSYLPVDALVGVLGVVIDGMTCFIIITITFIIINNNNVIVVVNYFILFFVCF